MLQRPAARPSRWITVGFVLSGIVLWNLGRTSDDRFDLIFGGALGLLIDVLFRLRRRVSDLERRLLTLEATRLGDTDRVQYIPSQIPPAVPNPRATPATTATIVGSAVPLTVPDGDISTPPIPREPPFIEAAREAGGAGTIARSTGFRIDRLWGGNTIARVGIVILFFGGSFLVKYAADHGHFPLEWRMAGLAIGSLALLGTGFLLRRRRPGFGQTLQGGGIAGFYLTVFAATRVFHLLPFGLALCLMVAAAFAGAVLAVSQDALALSVLGTGGGFLAPLLVPTGEGHIAVLFTYYTILNLGVFVVAWFRAWKVLNLLGFVFTFGIVGLFRAASYHPDQMVLADGFLLLFFLMYVGVTLLFSLRQSTDLRHYVSGSLVFGLPLAAFPLHASFIHARPFAMAWSALAFGGFYALLAWALLRSRRENFRLLAEAFAALAVIFGSLAVPLAFDGQTTAALWAVEGAGLVWLGMRQERRLPRAFGVLLQVAGGVAFWIRLPDIAGAIPVLNSAYLGCVLLGGSGLLSGWWLYRTREALKGYENGAEIALGLWGLAWFAGGTLAEIARVLPRQELGADLAFAALLIGALGRCGEWLAWPLLRITASASVAAAVGLGLLAACDLGHPSVQAAALGWPLVFAAAYHLLLRLDRRPEPKLAGSLPALHLGLLLAGAILVAWEASVQIQNRIHGVWPLLPVGLVPAAALWLLGSKPLVPAWPVEAHASHYRVWGGSVLASAALLWLMLVNLSSDGNPVGLPYIPLLNPLDLSTMLVVLSALRWWRGLDAALRARTTPEIPCVSAGLVFLWMNAALLRALHYGTGVPLIPDDLLQSALVQGAVSVFWGLIGFAAMAVASRRSWRIVWMVGAALMAVIVVKLFLVDTAHRGGLARIIAFLVVGGLLLVTGYLSPLPPRVAGTHGPDAGGSSR